MSDYAKAYWMLTAFSLGWSIVLLCFWYFFFVSGIVFNPFPLDEIKTQFFLIFCASNFSTIKTFHLMKESFHLMKESYEKELDKLKENK